MMSWFTTKGIVNDESPGDRKNQPPDKAKYSDLMFCKRE